MRAPALCLCLAAWCAVPAAQAASASSGAGALPRTAAVNLDFAIHIEKFLFFRIGDAAWPGLSAAPATVAFTLAPSIPGGPTTPVTGNNTPVNWSGSAPAFSVTPSGNVLPVEVRSNAGQVSLRATASTLLTSGPHTIPMSEITVATSNGALPAPLIPNSGTGAGVNVTGGGTGAVNTMVTIRNANWTFSYANSASRPAGSYSGQVTFTASTP